MASRGLVCSDDEVRRLLNGTLTQIRRLMRQQDGFLVDGGGRPFTQRWDPEEEINWRRDIRCPWGVPGDDVWIRETWGVGCRPDPFQGWIDGLEYRADCDNKDPDELLPLYTPEIPEDVCLDEFNGWQRAPSMPRWASRLSRSVAAVKVERLQSITEDDARKSGVEKMAGVGDEQRIAGDLFDRTFGSHPYVGAFAVAWDSASRTPWISNPWVWVVDLEEVRRE